MDDYRLFQAWFAGFVAGEGYFRIHKSKRGDYFACHFGIHMQGRGNRWAGPSCKARMEYHYDEMKKLRPYDEELAESDRDPFNEVSRG